MISTSVVPCLSCGLAKNNKMMSMFVLFSRLFAILKIWLFLSKMGGQTLHKAVKQNVLVNFQKVQQ